MFLYLDRLTRFKYPEDKYFRVFSDIILKNLIYPKISKKQLEQMPISDLIHYAQMVWQYSINTNFENTKEDFSINDTLTKMESSYYQLTKNSISFLNSKLNFMPLILELEKQYSNLPINLKRVCDIVFNRKKYSPIKKIILVEGITEDILLPKFAQLKKINLDELGIYIVVSGGKNQIVKQYTNWHKILKLPVFILLDKDGVDVFPLLNTQLEPKDEIIMLKSGEFEDLLDIKLILKTLKNTYPEIIEHISKNDFATDISTVENLENYFKINGLGEFKKADFAHQVSTNCNNTSYITAEIDEIIAKITDI